MQRAFAEHGLDIPKNYRTELGYSRVGKGTAKKKPKTAQKLVVLKNGDTQSGNEYFPAPTTTAW